MGLGSPAVLEAGRQAGTIEQHMVRGSPIFRLSVAQGCGRRLRAALRKTNDVSVFGVAGLPVLPATARFLPRGHRTPERDIRAMEDDANYGQGDASPHH